ncbi:MAG: DUF2384 domain-containing protein [Nitrococcus sp.]|nr:DUF2384 domain-containing protein [Nitrococcus sp.]
MIRRDSSLPLTAWWNASSASSGVWRSRTTEPEAASDARRRSARSCRQLQHAAAPPAGGRLGPAASDRLVRIARLYSLAEDVLESEEAASAWLREPVPMLDGEIPLDLLATDWGAERVREVLMRIEHGLFAG